MLFEHRDALIERQRLRHKQGRRTLDEQRLAEIADRLGEAIAEGLRVRLTLFHEDGDRTVSGPITRHDAARGRIRVGGEWTDLHDIIDCEQV
ncbi:YolD-like family protein [Paenibacillus sp. sptzw28]|uniref:YolD-like family protein n=1 Tax=Paenibacillus sp. sptzw28 TaxID=715179 RepID=UPI0037C7E636